MIGKRPINGFISTKEAGWTPAMFPVLERLPDILARMRRDQRTGFLFGPRLNPSKRMEHHDGVDLPCPPGTPIYSPWDGVVERAWEDKDRGGLSLIICHSGVRVKSGYAHLSGLALGIIDGVAVARGQEVALSGNSGMSRGPHLHFTIRIPMITDEWLKIDPLPFLLRSSPEADGGGPC